MAADFDEHSASAGKPLRGADNDSVFASEGGFDLDRLSEADSPLEPAAADPADEAELLEGAGTIDLDSLAPPADGRRKARSDRSSRGADVARRASTAKAVPARRPPRRRRGLFAAVAGVAAAAMVVALGLSSGLLAPSAPVEQPAVVAAVAELPAAPVTAMAAAPTPSRPAQPEPSPPAREPPAPTAVAEASPPEPPAEAPPPQDAAPQPFGAVVLAEAPVAPEAEALPDCRSEIAPDACWQSRLVQAQRLLVAAHLNARLAGVPAPDLRVGIDEWLDASIAAQDAPEARLELYAQRMERVDAVAAAHAVQAPAPPEDPPVILASPEPGL